MGLDKDIIDPDNGANITKKPTTLSNLDYEKNQSFNAQASYRRGTGQGDEEYHQAML